MNNRLDLWLYNFNNVWAASRKIHKCSFSSIINFYGMLEIFTLVDDFFTSILSPRKKLCDEFQCTTRNFYGM